MTLAQHAIPDGFLRVFCPEFLCRREMLLDEKLRGFTVACPACGMKFRVALAPRSLAWPRRTEGE